MAAGTDAVSTRDSCTSSIFLGYSTACATAGIMMSRPMLELLWLVVGTALTQVAAAAEHERPSCTRTTTLAPYSSETLAHRCTTRMNTSITIEFCLYVLNSVCECGLKRPRVGKDHVICSSLRPCHGKNSIRCCPSLSNDRSISRVREPT